MHSGEVLRRAARVSEASLDYRRAMDAVLGTGSQGTAAAALTGRTPETLAAQAIVYGLARMLVGGLLGRDIDGAAAERLAYEVTGVLGARL